MHSYIFTLEKKKKKKKKKKRKEIFEFSPIFHQIFDV